MLRLILFTMAALLIVSTAAIAQADVIYVEDFKEYGEPGFDPMFNHSFSAEPGAEPNWIVAWSTSVGHESECYLGLSGETTDTITFNMPSTDDVLMASVMIDHGLTHDTSIRFVGVTETWETGANDYGKTVIEMTSAQIGDIEQIEIYSRQGIFWNVTITVVPEPITSVLLLIMVFAGSFFAILRRRCR